MARMTAAEARALPKRLRIGGDVDRLARDYCELLTYCEGLEYDEEQTAQRTARLEKELEDALYELPSHHSAHWDRTMRHGAGCEECVRVNTARNKYRAALAATESASRIPRSAKPPAETGPARDRTE